jgi:hypothetical protein
MHPAHGPIVQHGTQGQSSHYPPFSATHPYGGLTPNYSDPAMVSQTDLTMYHDSAQTWSTHALINQGEEFVLDKALQQKLRNQIRLHYCTVDAFPDVCLEGADSFKDDTLSKIWSQLTKAPLSTFTAEERTNVSPSIISGRSLSLTLQSVSLDGVLVEEPAH